VGDGGTGDDGGLASAQDGAVTASDSGGGTSTSGGGRSRSGGDSLRLKTESAAPGKVFFNGEHRATYRYTIDGDRPRNLKIQAVNRRNWRVVKVWRKDDLEPGAHKVTWVGNNRDGKAAKKGTCLFRVRTKHGADIDRSRTKGDDRSVKFFPEKFPVRARHSYGDGFGAPRSGHTHQGQDVFADCGEPLVAARGGTAATRPGAPATTWWSMASRQAMTTSTCTSSAAIAPSRGSVFAPASGSPASGARATPRAATFTSSCGRSPAGTRAATR
jgi:hypothetical protein